MLTDGVRASFGASSRGLSRSLVVAEIVLAFILVSLGALLITQLGSLARIRPGFDPENLLIFHLNADPVEFPDLDRLAPYQKRLVRALDSIPGVRGASFTNQVALEGCCFTTYLYPEGAPLDRNRIQSVSFVVMGPDYFRTMGIPVIEGRIPDERDRNSPVPQAVVDASAARHYWPGRSAVGAYAHVTSEDGSRIQIVGVVGDVKNRSLSAPTSPELFFPNSITRLNQMTFLVRSTVPEKTLLGEIRRAIQTVNPLQPIFGESTMHEIVVGSIARQRLQSFMVSFFAVAALLMAILGVYGVVSYSVRQRTVEIGMRMAIGATSRDLFRMVVGDGLKMAAYGIGIGAAVSVVSALLLRANIFGIEIGDPRPFLFATAAIAGSTALACFFPAWRATLLSPMVAIRNDPGSIWENVRVSLMEAASKVAVFVGTDEEPAPGGESELLVEIAEAGRRAGSFAEATEIALSRLRDRIGASSIVLFVQKAPGFPYRCADAALPANGLLVSRLRNYDGALPVGPHGLDAAERWAAVHAPWHLPEILALRETGAVLAVRAALTDEIAGMLLVGAPRERNYYRAFEKRLLRGAATQFAMLIENARLTERIVEQERTRRELAMATEVQKRLFPECPPASRGIQLAGVSVPARSVGGDYYDFLDLGNNRIGLALADVAGKGIAAALIMSVVQASLRSLAGTEGVPLAQLAAKMNRLLHRSTGASSYATFFYAEIDEAERRLRYVNAGHNPPFLLRDGEIQELPAGGTIIGMFAQSTYEEGMLDLAPGDVLLAFTDGVPEALDPKDEEFGEERLQAALRRAAQLPVKEMAAKLLAELTGWIADAAQYDDLTFILMKVL